MNISRNKLILPVLLGLAHGTADCISGMIIGFLPGQMSGAEVGTLILLYNALAFFGQLPAGALLDRLPHPKSWVLLSLSLIGAAVMLHGSAPVPAIILAGCGSAIFHAGGGMVVLQALPFRAAGPGIFAGPGVMGLILGGFLAFSGINAMVPLVLLIAAITLILLVMPFPEKKAVVSEEEHGLDLHDLIMMVLLLAIAFRSAVWNVFSLIHHGEYQLLLWIGAAAAIGKISGGFLADFMGWRRYAPGVLGLAAVFLAFGEQSPWALLPGIALLQSATPVAVSAMHRMMPRFPATAAGLTFGLAIALGGLPLYFGLSPGQLPEWMISGVLLLTAGAYYLALSYRRKRPPGAAEVV